MRAGQLTRLVDALKTVMASERAVYAGLAELADQKKGYIIQNDLANIKACMRLEENALRELKELDQEKAGVLREIQQEGGLAAMPDLTAIIGLLEREAKKEELRALQRDFQNLIEDLKGKNNLNQTLLKTQLQYTSFCLELMTQGGNVGDLYGNTGRVQEDTTARMGLLDREA